AVHDPQTRLAPRELFATNEVAGLTVEGNVDRQEVGLLENPLERGPLESQARDRVLRKKWIEPQDIHSEGARPDGDLPSHLAEPDDSQLFLMQLHSQESGPFPLPRFEG